MEIDLKIKEYNLDSYILIGQLNNSINIESFKKKIKDLCKDSDLNYKTNVKGLFTGFNAFCEDLEFHDFIRSIKKEIKMICDKNFIIKDAWGNVYGKEGEAILHNHNGCTGFCGILYLTDKGPGTHFPHFNFTVEEKVGRFLLFHPLLDHEVKKINHDIERITIAFNANIHRQWE